MTRFRNRPKIQRATERLLRAVLMNGRLARLSYRLGGLGRVRVTRHEVALTNAAVLPRPLRIGFASDFHAGPTTDPALFDDLLAAIERERPDVLLLGGDYVSFKASNVDALAGFLRGARAPLGTCAVLGNHDVWNGRAPVLAALDAAGIAVLDNRSLRLPAPFDMVSICGIDDPWKGRPTPEDAFRDAGPVRIFLTHSPDGVFLPKVPRFDLALAGHTHNGQIVTPGGRPLFSAGGPSVREYSYGRFAIPDNGPLLVSCGVGCSGIPLRVNADPELLICTVSSTAK